ncbi:CAMK/CAMK1 protein kinase [Thecamonas trahens ATCC 50062]|uniref:CAMK/CAMK1 protein kinase n=1 Tax=Thecamonas trahens ATCC 50062 TaxID=461836 RepID=A0A0L0D6X9_THETB|nr:CAMK/CAMK1 protein kinase [Thecamonas trahens ATCC 50062]KNC48089.1 CAMK/CAMK1 protein kinase [Thecamonas trahens ATCC 50062]|eukprot:XP_013759102.1 CAMK/CAMK1 protein kinase [Thecamonas trahens ATCC 50062]
MPTLKHHYKVIKPVGEGKFSTVFLAKHRKSGRKVAIKHVDKNDEEFSIGLLESEVSIMKAIDHPNVVRLFDVFDSDESFDMVLEYVKGGELFDMIVDHGAYSEADASSIMTQILEAVAYLHEHDIVHRDLKPENLLCEQKKSGRLVVKIADFGLSKMLDEDVILATACGTPGYVAPEVLEQETATGYDSEVDMWACGVIMYILLCGFPPFYEDDMPALFDQILEGRYDYPAPYWDGVSASARDLIDHLLVVDPAARLTARQALAHPWISGTSASQDVLETFPEQLAKWNAKRKLKAAVRVVMLSNSLAAFAGGSTS